MACGITVAPIIPTAMVNACASGNCGVTIPMPAAAQSTGAMNISTRQHRAIIATKPPIISSTGRNPFFSTISKA
ncbi:hypothetical protein D3C76_1467180 [compost metagenome]